MPHDVELIAYADRLGGDLRTLQQVLDGPLEGLFNGVHLLPFFRPYDGADAGFDPQDHTEVDERLGSWDDVAAIGETHDVMVDVIVNHVSSSSVQFQDWLDKGEDSAYAGMFLTYDGAFPDGATEEQLMLLYRPRPGLPFTPYTRENGTKRLIWTTFTGEQIDLDVRQQVTRDYLLRVVEALAQAKVSRVRLDAVGYAVKTPGLTSFMTPETFDFIDEISAWCHERELTVLVEVHSYYQRQVEIAAQVDYVYDFALPPLILHALHEADADPLLAWLDVRPTNSITVLDTHDGIGVIDVGADGNDPSREGLLTPEQIDALVDSIHEASGGTSKDATGAAASNVDLYQVNCTFYDALGADDDRYLLARALQFWTPGIPQVYYVGLLAGRNDTDELERTGIGRDVNRAHYTREEVQESVQRPVVRALFGLIRLRGSHAAFDGELETEGGKDTLTMTWRQGDAVAELRADLAAGSGTVRWSDDQGSMQEASLSELGAHS
ncbi:MAG: sucrose phosphorylase [Ornithinimicrobium sp.]|uniref:sucrose phosphorylase n=1 Tax=Ornithinimicrobium sp. TaxID=1977084 RepID=UPI003D9B86F5